MPPLNSSANHIRIRDLLTELRRLSIEGGQKVVYGDLNEATMELDALLSLPSFAGHERRITFLLAPTGNLQQLSIDSGWGYQFNDIAEQIERNL